MPNIYEVIARVDALKLNTYSPEEKARWLIELDGRIFREVMKCWGDYPPEKYPDDAGKDLLVASPYDNIYDLYLFAMIDFTNREIANYNNSAAMFDMAYDEFKKEWHRTHRPPPTGDLNTMGETRGSNASCADMTELLDSHNSDEGSHQFLINLIVQRYNALLEMLNTYKAMIDGQATDADISAAVAEHQNSIFAHKELFDSVSKAVEEAISESDLQKKIDEHDSSEAAHAESFARMASLIDRLDSLIKLVDEDMREHLKDRGNPHNVTARQLGITPGASAEGGATASGFCVEANDDLTAIIPARDERVLIRYANMPAKALDEDGNETDVITDTVRYREKIGDGVTPLSDLPFVSHFQGGEGDGSMIQTDPMYGNGEDGEGSPAQATGQLSFAQGKYTVASGKVSAAMNYSATSSGERSFACNTHTVASGIGSNASGARAVARGNYSHAEGVETCAKAEGTHAEGYKTTASGKYSHSEGYQSVAGGEYSHAEGYNSQAVGIESHAEGCETVAKGNYSHSEGRLTQAGGEQSHAEGTNTQATGISAHSEGNSTVASGDYGHAEGYETKVDANAPSGHAEGHKTTVSGSYAHAEGYYTTASGNNSHAEGSNTTASSASAHAEGHLTEASGFYSHAEGSQTTASGNYSHSEGGKTIASGNSTHAEGFQTTASGDFSHSEGRETVASGRYSHAGGYQTKTNHQTGFAHGSNLETGRNCQAVFGQYNAVSSSSLLVIGDGSDADNRSNAFTVNTDKSITLGSAKLTEAQLSDLISGLNKLTVMPQIETGSYVGTGGYGDDNPNTITFGFSPKIVFIQTNYTAGQKQVMLIKGVTETGVDPEEGMTEKTLNLTWGENSVSWYTQGTSALYQLNDSERTYYWVAIG